MINFARIRIDDLTQITIVINTQNSEEVERLALAPVSQSWKQFGLLKAGTTTVASTVGEFSSCIYWY